MEFIPQNNLYNLNKTQNEFMIQLQQDLIDHQNKPQTPFSMLNQTLSNLNNDSLQRYNTQINPTYTQSIQFNQKSHNPPRLHHPRYNTTFEEVLIPQPWFNVEQSQFTAKFSLTQIRQRRNHFNCLSKSFHLSKDHNHVNQNNSSSHHFKRRSLSSHNEQPIQSPYCKNLKCKQKLNTFLTQQTQNSSQTFATYNYNSQQKARMTLQHLVHRKKHQKMSKILKLKAHSHDNTYDKQKKITNKSKHLIEALQKFSNDNILRKSIDRAVDVLKKRTHNLLYNKNNTKKQLQKTQINQSQTNWFSSHKIVINNCKEEQKKSERSNRGKKYDKFLISEDLKANMIEQEKGTEAKVKSKIAFKPKRSYLLDRRDQKKGQQQVNCAKGCNQSDGMNRRQQQNWKAQFSIRKIGL